MRRTSQEDPQIQDIPRHSVSVTPPGAASPGRCRCGSFLLKGWIHVCLGKDEWTPALGRTEFEIETSQIHFHPNPSEFLKHQLALVVHWWEEGHQRQFVTSGSRVTYRASPYTSLDVQRGALLTLEQNPTLAVTDLVRIAKQGNLVAPTPTFFLKALQGRTDGSEDPDRRSAHLDAERACHTGLHGLAVPEIQPGAMRGGGEPKRKPRRSPARGGRAYSLAQRLDAQVSQIEPMGLGNVAALAKHIEDWRRRGVNDDVIELMIDEFVQDFRLYCSEGSVPWRRFVGKRHTLTKVVEKHWSEQHGWDQDFEQEHNRLFGAFAKAARSEDHA